MCIEDFRHIMTRHKTIWCPSKTTQDGVSLCFFSVDLSRRKAVLLRGGSCWKGLGGINTYTSVPFCTTFPLALWSILRLSLSMQNEGLLVVLNWGMRYYCSSEAVVPQVLAVVLASSAVVPQELMVVPHLGSGSTVASGQALLLVR